MKKSIQLPLFFLFFPTLLFAEAPTLTSSLTMLELDKLPVSDAAVDDRAGISVAVDGDTAIVGAYGDDCGSDNYCGSAIIYERNSSSGLLEEKVKLTASDGAYDDQFGRSVAISGNTAVVGARLDDCDVDIESCGAVYIFEKPVSGWAVATNETAKLTASDVSAGDEFGTSVAVSGDTAVVGAPLDDCDADTVHCGAVYVFEKPVSGWTAAVSEDAKLTASDASAGDEFGASVAVSGEFVIAGAPGNESAYLFEKPAGGWTPTSISAILTASDTAVGDMFGSSVAISAGTAVVGAHFDDDAGQNSGSVYLFEQPGSGWSNMTQSAKFTASDGAEGDYFGKSVSVSGDKVIVGAYSDSVSGAGSGSAYLFQKPATGWAAHNTQTDKMIASDGSSTNWFGHSVSISGNTVVAGAYGESNATGATYQFEAVVSQHVVENRQTILDMDASDADGDAVAYSLSGGADAAQMNVNESSGLLSFTSAPDFEIPADANSDNIYEATLTISDGAEDSMYRVFVKVGDLDYEGEAPAAINFKELNKLAAPNTALNASFGQNIAISGTTAVVADIGERAVFVYEYQSGSNSFVKAARLTPTVPVADWGQSIAIDGGVVLVGASEGINGIDAETGLAYIFEKPPGGWEDMAAETAILSPSDGNWYDDFGVSVGISDDTIIVGAPVADIYPYATIYSNEGSAYIFVKPESGGWVTTTEDAKLIASDFAPSQYFGRLVDISGDTILVQSVDGSYLFEKPLTGWANAIEDVKLPTSLYSNYYGAAVNGDTVVLGRNGIYATIFQKPDGGSWKDATSDTLAADDTYPAGFGPHVDISGETVIVGASSASSAYLFEKPAAGWGTNTEVYATATLTASDGEADDGFGYGVAIFGDTTIIGAPFDDGATLDSGSAYVFRALDGVIVPGDINGDGVVDVKDVISGLQILAGENPSSANTLGDVNEDNRIGFEEVLYDLIELAE